MNVNSYRFAVIQPIRAAKSMVQIHSLEDASISVSCRVSRGVDEIGHVHTGAVSRPSGSIVDTDDVSLSSKYYD